MADYAARTAQRLQDGGFLPEQEWRKRKKVSSSEKGKTYHCPITPEKNCAVYQIDGKVIKAGNKCDKLCIILDENSPATVFIELKGKDISHAIDQLESTLDNNFFKPSPQNTDMVRARIVTNGCGPASASKKDLNKAKIRFIQKYNCDLRVLKSTQNDSPL